jgi:hypothetical protein
MARYDRSRIVTESDKPVFVAVLNHLAAVKPGAKLTPEAYEGWWLAMQDWSIADFRRAAAQLMQTVEFFPNPYHFNELRKKAAEQSAGEAWEKVLHAIRTMYVRDGASIDPKTDAVVRQMGGYAHLALSNSEDLKFRARDFQQLWADMGEVEEARTALPSASTLRINGPKKPSFGNLLEKRA